MTEKDRREEVPSMDKLGRKVAADPTTSLGAGVDAINLRGQYNPKIGEEITTLMEGPSGSGRVVRTGPHSARSLDSGTRNTTTQANVRDDYKGNMHGQPYRINDRGSQPKEERGKDEAESSAETAGKPPKNAVARSGISGQSGGAPSLPGNSGAREQGTQSGPMARGRSSRGDQRMGGQRSTDKEGPDASSKRSPGRPGPGISK